jgi:hypothetical protein
MLLHAHPLIAERALGRLLPSRLSPNRVLSVAHLNTKFACRRRCHKGGDRTRRKSVIENGSHLM